MKLRRVSDRLHFLSRCQGGMCEQLSGTSRYLLMCRPAAKRQLDAQSAHDMEVAKCMGPSGGMRWVATVESKSWHNSIGLVSSRLSPHQWWKWMKMESRAFSLVARAVPGESDQKPRGTWHGQTRWSPSALMMVDGRHPRPRIQGI